ncbi:MAG: hypothetical protein Q4G08_11575, partial [Capnocytophaga sp.]|nr:hypothetical protein [Capnocytophaga sp.]
KSLAKAGGNRWENVLCGLELQCVWVAGASILLVPALGAASQTTWHFQSINLTFSAKSHLPNQSNFAP